MSERNPSVTPDPEIHEFATQAEAEKWMNDMVDDPYIDNDRFAFLDDPQAMTAYSQQIDSGCCGQFDALVKVGGKLAKVGCNYGH